MSLNVITRGDWGALPPKKVEPLAHPVPYICLSYNNKVKEHSVDLIRDIQKSHMNIANMDDIQSNFLIALDGTVYEGRGWHAQPAKLYERYEKYNGKFIDITLLGEYKANPDVESPQLKNILEVIRFGKREKFIAEKYDIVWPDMEKK